MGEVMQYSNRSTPDVQLSDAAIARIVLCLGGQPDCKAIRLSVKKTGCSGLSYVMDYVQAPLEQDIVLPLVGGLQICIDKASYPYLKGIHMDYVKQGLNQKFVFNNPNQTGQCGCGESFTVDELPL